MKAKVRRVQARSREMRLHSCRHSEPVLLVLLGLEVSHDEYDRDVILDSEARTRLSAIRDLREHALIQAVVDEVDERL